MQNRYKIITCASKPEFVANTFGMTNRASAYAATPSLALPFTVSLNDVSSLWAVTSNAAAPIIKEMAKIRLITTTLDINIVKWLCATPRGLTCEAEAPI